MMDWWFVPVSILVLAARILGQPSTEGFISIDCGFDESSSYKDQTTGLTYSSDNGFIDSGVNHKIDLSASTQLKSLRSFPNGTRNCYSFTSFEPGTKLLIRAAFFYGNYDGQNSVKSSDGLRFDLWIGTKFWTTMNLVEVDDAFTAEVITVTATKYLWVCLVSTGHGTPFISLLELRPLDSKLYPAANESQHLILSERLDYGSSANQTRYPDDQYDRIWTRAAVGACLPSITTDKIIGKSEDDLFEVPSSVMQTAVTPCINNNPLTISWHAATYGTDIYYEYHFFMHFADFQKASTRVFQAYINQALTQDGFSPAYLLDRQIFSINPFKKVEYEITLKKTNDSVLPPLINALEIYQVTARSEVATNSSDVDALMSLKNQYQVKKNWMGDPCAPQTYSWDGVTCNNYSNSGTPRVITLNLSSSGLTGEIPSSLANLGAITSLDLSSNSLEGKIPDSLAALPSLQLLNLTGNSLSGSVPPDLWSKFVNGSLKLSVEGNPNLCTNVSSCGQNHCTNWGSCGRKKKIILSLSIVSVVLVVGLVLCVWRLGSRKSTSSFGIESQQYTHNELEKITENFGTSSIGKEYQQYTYNELEEITENFGTVLGEGGFGTVYLGTLKSGTQVAVKKLSEKSAKATKDFEAEIQTLTRVHHTSLVPLIGYWRDGGNLALVYEYMAGGSLQKHLSGERSSNWVERLQIALGVAQGLEYLHVGCKPPIVHRDVKTSNILLDDKLEAKVADFGLAREFSSNTETHKTLTMIGGTPGYVDPEYNSKHQLGPKSDVYSFGVVLFELITGHPALLEDAGAENLVDWVELKLKSDGVADTVFENGVADIVDSRLKEYSIESMTKVVELAKRCTEKTRNKRPSMSDVVANLTESLKLEKSFQLQANRESTEAPLRARGMT